MFRPTPWKLFVPVALVALALLPLQLLRVFVFETLAYPFGPLLNSFRYVDKPYLNFFGVLLVAVVWAAIFYIAASVSSSIFDKADVSSE